MLKLCNYATVYNVIFNSKKTVCIKFGNEREGSSSIGNIIDNLDCTELADCVFKKSMCIGYVNKLRSNFSSFTDSCINYFV